MMSEHGMAVLSGFNEIRIKPRAYHSCNQTQLDQALRQALRLWRLLLPKATAVQVGIVHNRLQTLEHGARVSVRRQPSESSQFPLLTKRRERQLKRNLVACFMLLIR